MNWMYIIEQAVKIVIWLLEVSRARKETKERFLGFIQAMEKRSLVSADLRREYKRQIRRGDK